MSVRLLLDFDAFFLEHRLCGDLNGGTDDERVWMACSACGARIYNPGHGTGTDFWRCVMDEDRRSFFQRSSQLAAGALAVGALAASTSEAQAPAQTPSKKLKIMMRSGWGTDDPTRGSFVFAHALAFADAGHDVQIFLTGEATYLMRKATVDAVKPIGWPPLTEMMEKVVAKHIPVFS